MMTSGAAKNEDFRDSMTNEYDDYNDSMSESEGDPQTQQEATTALDKTLPTTLSNIGKAAQAGNISAGVEHFNNEVVLYLPYVPDDYKNNVISSVADKFVDMRDNGRRIFRDKEQVLTFLNGILSGSLHRQPKRVKESIKNDNLTKNKILNPKLMNYKPKPFTNKHNYVFKGNSLKTVI